MRKLFVILSLLLFWAQTASAVCYITDVECIADEVLSGYDPNPDSEREWSSNDGIITAFQNKITARIRFDQESINILKSNGDFGLEVEMVVSGNDFDSVQLDRAISSFLYLAHAGSDTTVCDSGTNEEGTKVFAIRLLNLSDLEANVDYFVLFEFEENLPDGLKIQSNLQITIDMYSIHYGGFMLDWISWFDQFTYYALETDSYYPFWVNQEEFTGVKWDSKSGSEVFSSASEIEVTEDLQHDPDEDPAGGSEIDGITDSNPEDSFIDSGDIGTTPNGPDANVKEVELSNYGADSYHHTLTIETGQSFDVRLRITNKEDEDINYFEVFVHRFPDKDFDEDNDYSYGREEEDDTLHDGGSTAKHRTCTAPTTPGTYYIFGYINRVDGADGGEDQDWNNNYSRNDDLEEYGVLIVKKAPAF